MVEFGKRLKELRKQRDLTQKQLAELLGTKDSIISFYETGERNPSPEIIKKLATILGVSTDYLMGMSHNHFVCVDGLTDTDKLLVNNLIDTLRNKNNN